MNERFVEAVAKLIELTQLGKLHWKAYSPDETLKVYPDDRLSTVFETNYQGRKLRVYRRTFKLRDATPMVEVFIGKKDWQSVVILEFLAENNAVLWRFPTMPILDDLLSAVQYQVAGVDEFIDALLKS